VTVIENHTLNQRATELTATIGSKTAGYSKHLLAAYRVAKLCRLPTAIAQCAASEEQAEWLFAKLEALVEQLPATANPTTQQMMEYLTAFNTLAYDLNTLLGLVHYAPRKSMAIGAVVGAALSVPAIFVKPVLWETIMLTGIALGMAVGVGVHLIQIQYARQQGKYF